MSTPSVGNDIEDTCSRCGDSWHVVMAKVGERVVKVVCKRCGTQHNYRGNGNSPEAKAAAGAPGARKRTFSKRGVAEEPAPTPIPDFDATKAPKPYSSKGVFGPHERVDHPAFGVGVVASLPGPGKVEVVFPAGVRVLACAKVESTLERPIQIKHAPIADRPPDAK